VLIVAFAVAVGSAAEGWAGAAGSPGRAVTVRHLRKNRMALAAARGLFSSRHRGARAAMPVMPSGGVAARHLNCVVVDVGAIEIPRA